MYEPTNATKLLDHKFNIMMFKLDYKKYTSRLHFYVTTSVTRFGKILKHLGYFLRFF